jgi:hypothetical protein
VTHKKTHKKPNGNRVTNAVQRVLDQKVMDEIKDSYPTEVYSTDGCFQLVILEP